MTKAQLRILYLQHVPFEEPARISSWALDRGHSINGTMLFRGDEFPGQEDFDNIKVTGVEPDF